MTGPEHYQAAEEDIADMNGKSPEGVRALLARAQVHATLALASELAVLREHFEDVHRAGWSTP